MKKWKTIGELRTQKSELKSEEIIEILLTNRKLKTKKEIDAFLNPPSPYTLTPKDVGIEKTQLNQAIKRIREAIKNKESIVVYADYDADGITAGAIMWETLYKLGARVMPYIPHRVEQGYGLSVKGIDAVREQYDPSLIITVDHGITAKEKVDYAKSLGIEVIITDHHVKPKELPKCLIVHTTLLSGAGVSWFVAKEILLENREQSTEYREQELTALAAIGTIADMMTLLGPNRSIAKFGLAAINKTSRVGLEALMYDAGLTKGEIATYNVSHMLSPRLNAMGRIEHALDALRLLCTNNKEKAMLLAQKLGLTNKERQQLTVDTVLHARELYKGQALKEKGLTAQAGQTPMKKLIFIAHESYNQGVIGLVAGRIVEEFYRPTIVVSVGEEFSKASARSVNGFNIVEAIRSCSDILVDVGGHPMAAGFTVETKHLGELQKRLEVLADKALDEEKLTRVLKIDAEIPLVAVTEDLWKKMQDFEPFGFGNSEPVFATRGLEVEDARLVGKEGKHLRLELRSQNSKVRIQAIAFNFGSLYGQLKPETTVDIAYSIDMNVWNGNKRLQLKIKDINY